MNARPSLRRRLLIGLALLAICMAAATPAARSRDAAAGANSWSPMTLPYAMNITALALAPSYPCDKLVFMATDGHGVFRAADSGGDALWVGINNGLSDLGVLALAVSPNYGRCDRLTDRGDRTIFIGARSGVYRTVNGGASWEPRTDGLPSNAPVQSVSISPNYASDRTVFAGFEGSLFRSVDGGTTWQPFDSGLTDRAVQAFAVSANYANDSTMFVGTRFSGIYRIAAKLQDTGAVLLPTPTPATGSAPAPGVTPTPAASIPGLPRDMQEAPMQMYSAAQPGDLPIAVRPATAAEAARLTLPALPPGLPSPVAAGPEYTVQQVSNDALRLTVFAGAADDSKYAPNGGEWPSVTGPVRIKYEIRNISAGAVDDITLVDDNGTPDNPNDDVLVSKDIVGQSLAAGSSLILHRTVVVTGALDQLFTLRATLTGTAGGTALPPISDSALVRITTRGPKLKVILWAGAPDDSQFATDGAVWTTVPGRVKLKYEIKNIGDTDLRNVLLTDDNGTPANPNDDPLVNKDSVNNVLAIGGAVVFSRDVTVTKDTTLSATATGYFGAGLAQSVAATDDAIVQVITQNTNASLKMVVTVTNTLQGQTYFGVPGPVSVTVTVINNGAEPVRSIRAVLDAAGNDAPGCKDNPATDTADETFDDLRLGTIGLLAPGQQTTLTSTIAIGPAPGTPPTANTFPPIRMSGCAIGQVGQENAPFEVGSSDSFVVQLVVWQSITPSNSALYNLWVTSFATSPFFVNDQTIFAGTAYGGLFRSMNAATSTPAWELVNQGLEPQWTWIRSIAVSPRYPYDRTIYVGTESGVYRGVESFAGGPFTWTKLNTGLTALDVRAVGISPDYGRDSTIFAGVYGADVYRLTADADDRPWQPYRRVLNGLWSWAVNLTQDGVLLAGTWGRSIGRMTLTTGSDWNYQFQGVPSDAEVTSVAVSPGYCAGYTVFAGAWSHGLFRSVDGGASWTATAYPAATGPVRGIAISPLYERGHTLAVATWGGGVLVSENDGLTWRVQNAGLTDLKVRAVAYPPGWPYDPAMFAVTDTAGLFRYQDGRWVPTGSGLPAAPVMTVALSPNYNADGVMAVGTWGAGVYLSNDRGASWRAAAAQPNLYVRAIVFSPDFAGDGVMYAGTNLGAYRSSNRGDAWSGLGLSSEVGAVDVTGIAVSATAPRTLFVSTGGRGVWQYTETPGGQLLLQSREAERPQPAITTQDFVYRSFIPMTPKGRPRNPC